MGAEGGVHPPLSDPAASLTLLSPLPPNRSLRAATHHNFKIVVFPEQPRAGLSVRAYLVALFSLRPAPAGGRLSPPSLCSMVGALSPPCGIRHQSFQIVVSPEFQALPSGVTDPVNLG